jgi:hypothetical protein
MKWPAFAIVRCGWPAHPGIRAARDRIRVTEQREERLVESAQLVPGGAVRRARRIVGARRHEHRKLPRACLVGLVGERRVVGSDHLGRDRARATAADDLADRELGDGLAELKNASGGL